MKTGRFEVKILLDKNRREEKVHVNLTSSSLVNDFQNFSVILPKKDKPYQFIAKAIDGQLLPFSVEHSDKFDKLTINFDGCGYKKDDVVTVEYSYFRKKSLINIVAIPWIVSKWFYKQNIILPENISKLWELRILLHHPGYKLNTTSPEPVNIKENSIEFAFNDSNNFQHIAAIIESHGFLYRPLNRIFSKTSSLDKDSFEIPGWLLSILDKIFWCIISALISIALTALIL